jgi:hypothetical protein
VHLVSLAKQRHRHAAPHKARGAGHQHEHAIASFVIWIGSLAVLAAGEPSRQVREQETVLLA